MPVPILATTDLAIGYPAPRQPPRLLAAALHLKLDAGELVCLLGPNGAGKSTLLRTLAGMQPPLRGAVWLAGTDPHRSPPRELARRLGVVLTERPEVGLLSVRALAALGRYPHTSWTGRLKPRDEAAIDRALAAVGVTALASRPVKDLSDGERQKVMIARALTQEPQLLLLDEPTAFLDLPRRVELLSLLRRLAREEQRAILMSTHDLDLALRVADKVWLLAPGGELRVGLPEELALDGSLQASFQGEDLVFDPLAGAFRFHHPPVGQIDLSGDGLPALWTRRALEREGFTVNPAKGPRPALRIEVHDQGGQRTWRLRQAATCQDFWALSQVISALKGSLSR